MSSHPPTEHPATLLYGPLPTATTETINWVSSANDLIQTSQTFQPPLPPLRTTPHSRASRSAKAFYCPQCDKPLKVAPDLIECSTKRCAWDPKKIGIQNIPGLLQREADPFPENTRKFRQLVNMMKGNDDRDGVDRRRSSMTLLSTVSSKSELGTHGLSRTECFVRAQDMKEADIFARYMPGGPPVVEEDVSELMGEIDMADMVPRERRRAAGTWFRRDEVAYRKLRAPRIEIEMEGGETLDWGKREEVIPVVQVFWKDDDVVVEIRNRMKRDMVVELLCGGGRKDVEIAAKGVENIVLSGAGADVREVNMEMTWRYIEDGGAESEFGLMLRALKR